MARKNPDKAKEAFKTLSAEILKYGDEGKQDLRDLFEAHKPEVIFKLEPGPERQARAAQLIGEMRELSQELARAKYERERKERKAPGKRSRTSKAKPKPKHEISGAHERFRYVLVELPDGKWAAKITRRGRKIIPHSEAPPIVDSEMLKRRFSTQEDAERAVRRVINTALLWYDERGIRPQEKVRRTQRVRAGVQRRTAGQVAAMEREAKGKRKAEEEKERRERARETRRRAKVAKHERQRRPKEPSPIGRGRKLSYIPRNNPSNPFSFSYSESAALKKGHKALKEFKEWKDRWEESYEEGNPDFRAIMKAYDHVENARANFTIAEEEDLANKAHDLKRSLRKNIIYTFKFCNRELRKRQKNPSRGDHQEMGNSHMMRADVAWKKYCDSCKFSDLLNAYKHLEIAREELQHAGDTEGVAQAKSRIKLARQELRKRSKG